MIEMSRFLGRRAVFLENDVLRVVVLENGGHIASVTDKATGINPLWIPPWRTIEPPSFTPADQALYGSGAEARLLAGIMGHNLCLDLFGGPSTEEAAAGLTAHGEAPVIAYDIEGSPLHLRLTGTLPLAQIRVERQISLIDRAVRVREAIENLTSTDRPVAWTQHVTLGPPFLERGVTEFRTSATRSRVMDGRFGDHDYLQAGAVFEWPQAPRSDGGTADLRTCVDAPHSSAYTTHLMDPRREDAFFVAYAPAARLAFGYVWRQTDFPWLGIWEENHSRTQSPWSGRTLTRGLEFGVSPFPESRRAMVERGRLFEVPTFAWLPARSRLAVEYWVVCGPAASVPDELARPS